MDIKNQISGFPEWTDFKNVKGVDPLGMHRPNEAIYQTLIPGMTTITERYRYYSFFCWVLHMYPQQEDTVTNNLDKFRNFQKRAEGLYALVCMLGDKDTGKSEMGVAGSKWASKKLWGMENNSVESINFIEDSDPTSSHPVRHLKSKVGAFGGIYITQMRLLGMVGVNDHKLKEVPFCTNKALRMANGFSEILGDQENSFINAINSGDVTKEFLASLSRIRLSEIQENSMEHKELTSFLLQQGDKLEPDDLNRCRTLKMLLKLIDFLGKVPKEDEIRWTWFGSGINEGYESGDTDQQKKWKVFQMNDLIRLSYQILLKYGVQELRNSEYASVSLNELVSKMIEKLNLPEQTVDLWLGEKINENTVESQIKNAYEDMFKYKKEEKYHMSAKSALFIVFAVISITKEFNNAKYNFFSSKGEFQSLQTEGRFVTERLSHKNITEITTELIRERIIKRHLLVATRKLRFQNSYTFLFEPDDHGLRFRRDFKISTSTPRLKQALVFLRDIKFIDDNGICRQNWEGVE